MDGPEHQDGALLREDSGAPTNPPVTLGPASQLVWFQSQLPEPPLVKWCSIGLKGAVGKSIEDV